jgi:hypothetical protein
MYVSQKSLLYRSRVAEKVQLGTRSSGGGDANSETEERSSGSGEGFGPVPKITCKIILILGARGLYRRPWWNPKPIPRLT